MRAVALTIAGSDSSGGAGIQADLKTFQAFGVYGASAVTAVTVQDTRGVSGVHAVPRAIVAAQIARVVEDLHPAACKTGMLAERGIVEAVAETIREKRLPNLVVDPVMVATSGDRLLDAAAEATVAERLLPLCTIVTPNLDEGRILTGIEAHDAAAMVRVGLVLRERGAPAALVKGGHLAGDTLVDILCDAEGIVRWERRKVPTTSTHGTGCTLSAAIAAGLARGRPLRRAVADALHFVQRAIEAAPGLGHGRGPLNHFVRVEPGPEGVPVTP